MTWAEMAEEFDFTWLLSQEEELHGCKDKESAQDHRCCDYFQRQMACMTQAKTLL